MKLQENIRFSNNWWIKEQTTARLREQEEIGWFDKQTREYIGDSRDLGRIAKEFAQVSQQSQSGRLYVRRSCVDALSNRYTVVELYLSTKQDGQPRHVIEATWTAPQRLKDSQVVEAVNEQFQPPADKIDPPYPIFTEGFY